MTERQTSIPDASPAGSPRTCCPIVELRQYTLHPGKREVLIELFDREFVESQEAAGMRVIGQFRDLDDPNRFVWLRGFGGMAARAAALQAFYGGSVWKTYRNEANATMVDSDNVLLLRPAHRTSGFSIGLADRPPPGTNGISPGLVVATLCYFGAPVSSDFLDFFERVLKPVMTDAGATILARFVTESAMNTFAALPVREGENVFAWFSRFPDQAAYEQHLNALGASPRWRGDALEALSGRLERPAEILKLSPTARSQLRG